MGKKQIKEDGNPIHKLGNFILKVRHYMNKAILVIFLFSFYEKIAIQNAPKKRTSNLQRHFNLLNHVIDGAACEQENLSSYCFKVY